MRRRTELYNACSFLALSLLSGCMYAIPHDEDAAAKKAAAFALVAFINHDVQASYALLAEDARRNITLERYADAMKQLHPFGFPTTVTAIQYEPILGQRALSIILVGQNGEQKFFYRLVMFGTSDAGYAVGGFFRSNKPYLGSPNIHGTKMLRPLKVTYTVPTSNAPATPPNSGATDSAK